MYSPFALCDIRCPILFLVLDVLQVNVRHDSAPFRVIEVPNLHEGDVLKAECFIATLTARAFDKCPWPGGGSCAQEEEERNLHPNEAMKRLSIVDPEGMKDSVKVLDKHRELFLLSLI